MTDGQPDIVGPIGSLVGLGIMAYGAKSIIDIMKDKAIEEKKRKKSFTYQEPRQQAPRVTATNIQADDRITSGLNKMLGR